jgi:hypothetical protein
VTAQGAPPHSGSPTPRLGYDNGDPYAEFLPSAVATDENGNAEFLRAVVIITEETELCDTRRAFESTSDALGKAVRRHVIRQTSLPHLRCITR